MISYKSVIEFTKIAFRDLKLCIFNSYFVTSPIFFNFLTINSLRVGDHSEYHILANAPSEKTFLSKTHLTFGKKSY